MARHKKKAAQRSDAIVVLKLTKAEKRLLVELGRKRDIGPSTLAARIVRDYLLNQWPLAGDPNDKALNMPPKQTYVQYNQADDKTYYRREWRGQCSVAENILGGECQGVEGHSGQHWSYREDGSYSWWRNTNEASIIDGRDVAGGWTPPDHKDYVSPAVKFAEHWRQFFTDTVVTDAGVIALLDADNPPEGVDAGITRPCTDAEIEWLRREGRLP